MKNYVRAILSLICATAWFTGPAAAQVSKQSGFLLLSGEADEPLTGGQPILREFVSGGKFNFLYQPTKAGTRLTLSWVGTGDDGKPEQWSLAFRQAQSVSRPLDVGHYRNAQRFNTGAANRPSMLIWSNHRTCQVVTGSFRIRAFDIESPTSLLSLAIDFEQYCDGSPSPLTGAIRINSPIPVASARAVTPADFDGDGSTDLSVFQVADGIWSTAPSREDSIVAVFGAPNFTDLAVPGDYDGDGIVDRAVYRPARAIWSVQLSSGGTLQQVWGSPGSAEIPFTGDFDGDGKDDFGIYRPSQSRWLIRRSGAGDVLNVVFGPSCPTQLPVPADYDGDGITDLAAFEPATGTWTYRLSSGPILTRIFGERNFFHVPSPGDYDGDGYADSVVFEPSTARWLSVLTGGDAMSVFYGRKNGADIPVLSMPDWYGYFRGSARCG